MVYGDRCSVIISFVNHCSSDMFETQTPKSQKDKSVSLSFTVRGLRLVTRNSQASRKYCPTAHKYHDSLVVSSLREGQRPAHKYYPGYITSA